MCPVPVVEKDVSLMPVVEENMSLVPVVEENMSLVPIVEGDMRLMPVVEGDMRLMPVVEEDMRLVPVMEGNMRLVPVVEGNMRLMPIVEEDMRLMPIVEEDMRLIPVVEGELSPMPVVEENVSLMSVVEENVSSMPVVEGDVSSMPVVEGDRSSIPLVEGDVSPMSVVEENGSLMSVVEENVSLMSVVEGDVSPMSVVEGDGSLMSVVEENGSLMSVVEENVNAMPVGEENVNPMPVVKENVEGEKEISTHSQNWGEQQLLPAYTPTSQHQITSSPSVIQQEPKIGSASGSASQEDRTNEEETDNEENGDENADNSEDHHSIVLHLISQLRFGMDLTKVALPTFILETRSLLEMFANFMAHPDLLLSIGSAATPEERAISFVEYYLTSFREGRKGSVAKKPYNPILGEIFHCSWDIPKDQVKPLLREQNEAEAPAPSTEPDREHSPRERYKLRFVAEQVSHHPPVSCFYCECKERGMFVNTHVWTKSKFMGMSVGVSLLGEGVLRLLDYEEDYIFTLPNAYARSILTIPWVELGGKVTMECAKTGYTALVTFHTKPFYGGKVHRVTAEVKHKPSNTVVCKAQGEWNGVLEFTYSNGETKLINTAALPVYPKKVRPIEKQEPMESRNLWREVTNSIKVGDMNSATEFKRNLEDKQRKEEQERASRKAEWRPRYFNKQGEGWMYRDPLLKGQ